MCFVLAWAALQQAWNSLKEQDPVTYCAVKTAHIRMVDILRTDKALSKYIDLSVMASTAALIVIVSSAFLYYKTLLISVCFLVTSVEN